MSKAGKGQFLNEEEFRGKINGGRVMPGEPTFTQPKNGVPEAGGGSGSGGEALSFETDVTSKTVTRGNRSGLDLGG